MIAYLDDTAPVSLDLNTRRNEIHQAHNSALQQLIECGRLLVDTQRQLDNESSFVAFCDSLRFSRTTAYNYMRLYQHSLVQQLDSLEHALINMSVWYLIEPQDSETVTKIRALADSGKKVTKELAKQLVQETAPLHTGLLKAAESAPDYVAETIIKGTFVDFDGHDKPLSEIDDSILEVNTDEFLYERVQRQKSHIEQSAKKKVKLTVDLQLVRDESGRLRLALPEIVPAWLAGKEITFYYEDDDSQITTESVAAA